MASSIVGECIVVGGGTVGLATARALAKRGARVLLSAPTHRGIASTAAAGVLGATIAPAPGPAFEFALASRELFPAHAAELLDETGVDIELDLSGVLRVALSEEEVAVLRAQATPEARWLTAREVGDVEPSLKQCMGALFHSQDGMVANEIHHSALRKWVMSHEQIRVSDRPVLNVVADERGVSAFIEDGEAWTAQCLVLAAGAWTPEIGGVSEAPVEAVRGQMVVLAGRGLRRPVYGAGGYLTPRRDGRILAGSTLERVGFDTSTTPAQLDRLELVATTLLPHLAGAKRVTSWAGLRPFSPDGLPILGLHPGRNGVIFATGHSKNGILMGPLTGEVVADLALLGSTGRDISAFSPARFGSKSST